MKKAKKGDCSRTNHTGVACEKYDGSTHAFPTEFYEKYSGLNELLAEPKTDAKTKNDGLNYPISSGGQKKHKNIKTKKGY